MTSSPTGSVGSTGNDPALAGTGNGILGQAVAARSAATSRNQPHREFRVDEAVFDFWHRLSRAASYAAVLALTDGPNYHGA